MSSLNDQLKGLTLFRVCLVTVLLAATFVFNLQDASHLSDRLYVYLYYLCTAIYIASVLYVVAIRLLSREAHLLGLMYLQLFGDVLFASGIVLVTGATGSVFTFFFSLVIIGASIVLFRPGALYAASTSALALFLIALLELDALPYAEALGRYRLSFLPEIEAFTPKAETDQLYRVVYNTTVNILAFYGIALLSSWLSEKVRSSAQKIRTQAQSFEELHRLHRHIVNSIPSGLITIDPSQEITFLNRASEDILGWSSSNALGLPIGDVFRDARIVLENPHKLRVVTREQSSVIVKRRRRDIGWSLSPVFDGNGHWIGHTLMLQDITKLKDLERLMYRAEKLAAVGELAAAVAHEVRNPLAAISGSIQLLRNKLDLRGTELRLMNIVLRETEGLNQWINEFLEYSRPPPIHSQPFDLTLLLNDAVAAFSQDEAQSEIAVKMSSEESVWALGDTNRMKQVLWNLLNNAAQSMPEGGNIHVDVKALSNGSHPLVELTIQDEGVGIPTEDLDRVFHPFFTTKERGTGLGLAVVHQIMENHGGQITVKSEPSEGTTFRLVLPMSVERSS